MLNKIDRTSIVQKYKEGLVSYEKLGLNLTQVLELLLIESEIPFLSINYRIKKSDSFIGKIEKKLYVDPFQEIEDICGIRIICYYQSDIDKITNLIKKELLVLEDQNKGEQLDFDKFGYRSRHFIVKIPQEWAQTPNYRNLENLKSELQVRTVLMHAWAEIEHKLAYKSETQIPKEFRRKLSRISAKLEESDEQFEEIKSQIENNKNQLVKAANESKKFDIDAEFNLDNLQAFLDYSFPNRKKNLNETSELFNEMIINKISLKDLITGYNKSFTYLSEIEDEDAKVYGQPGEPLWVQVGAARTILELTNDNYFNNRPEYWETNILSSIRDKIKIKKT